MSNTPKNKDAVRKFWENNPLFSGEVELDPMSREFVERHESIYRGDVLAGRFPDLYFPFAQNATVIDVGCGPGIWTRELVRRGYRVTAVDLTERAVLITRRSLEISGLEADVRQGDAENLLFPAGTFDGVVSHGVIHHTPDTQRCLSEMARVLKPGGIAVVSVYYRNAVLRSRLLTRLVSLLLRNVVSLPGRGRERLLRSGDADEIVRLYDGASNPIGKAYSAVDFEQMVRAAGLTVTNRERYYFPTRAFGRMGGLVRPLQPWLARKFGMMYTVIARKPGSSR